ncbi:MAG: cytochrome c3 family protein [Coraliomargaritaceae bacterium]
MSIRSLAVLTAGTLLLAGGCSRQEVKKSEIDHPASAQEAHELSAFPYSHDPARMQAIGAEACVECHADEVAAWKRSHHAKANRPLDPELDGPAFTPARVVEESGVIYRMREESGAFIMEVLEADAVRESYELVGVIGETPIRQYLALLPGNKVQTISATYNVLNDTWYDVYRGEDRLPGEWGHWTGQGMNWNANCAYCHTTEYEKKYDFENDRYDSTWTQQSIACAECHNGLEEHVKSARRGDYRKKLETLSPVQTLDNCASCHSRRDQITADAFLPGDAYEDHFSLATPAQPGLYHHDGQILDEVFVHGSFSMSRMAHAGVTCMDCHDPHSMEHILPVENNELCLRCHDNGLMGAPIIEPTQHSHHGADSMGNRCVECHMPKTLYMQADARADHGFHKPDPLITRELGIPNACSRCHEDESLDWAVEWSEKWYGEKLANSRQRQRARAIAAAHNFDPAGLDALLQVAAGEDIPYWIGTYAGLMANYLPNRRAEEFLERLLEHESPIVRREATASLARDPSAEQELIERLSDSVRSVRFAAARALQAQSEPHPSKSEFVDYLNYSADRPQSLMMLASQASEKGDVAALKKRLARAIEYDRLNGEVYRQAAILLSGAGLHTEARDTLFTGWEKDPKNALFPYSLGLLAAETGDLQKAIGYLEECTALQPDFSRAWYNLSLAYSQQGRQKEAERAMNKARRQ